MSSIIDFLMDNPLYAAAAAALIIFFAVALFKKTFKLVAVAVALNLAYVYYLQDIAEDTYGQAYKSIESTVDSAKDVLDK